jgi:peptidoglycan/LPS O-acetylase OafA/YrhL
MHLGRVPALDGVRGLAILWVMLFHMAVVAPVGLAAEAWQAIAGYGGLGVDIFFVLSGFLITGVLLQSRQRPNYFRNFYARRALRIFPLYYAVVLFALVILPHVTTVSAAKFQIATRDAIWYWLHLSNFAIARRGAFVHGILDVSWSLSIEEQFYLIWPVVVLLTSARRLRLICLALVLLSCCSRIILTSRGVNSVAVYTLTFCRLDGLSIGALTALYTRALPSSELRRILPGISALALVVACLTLYPTQAPAIRLVDVGLRNTAIALVTASAIIASLVPSRTLVTVLCASPLRMLGRFSYALYLFHYPLMAALRDTILKPAGMPLVLGSSLPAQLAFDLVTIAVSILAAVGSWHAYEKWFLRLKRYF